MPSVFTHAVAAVAFGRAYTKAKLPLRFWILSAGCAIAPDMDVMGKRLGIEYSDMLGHRGLSHSLLFAAILSAIIVLLAFRKPIAGISRRKIFLLLFLATASHGILDAMVDGTLGVAFFAPFDAARFFLPWRPIISSPIGWAFFSAAGVTTLMNEFFWIWIPSLIVIIAPWWRNRTANERAEKSLQSLPHTELQNQEN